MVLFLPISADERIPRRSVESRGFLRLFCWRLLSLAFGLAAMTVCVEALGQDYNMDGQVGAADFTVWRDLLGTNNPAADGNGNGTVDAGDYDVWATNYMPDMEMNGSGTLPLLTIENLGPNVAGNLEWAVQVTPDAQLFANNGPDGTPPNTTGGSIATEIGFEVTGSSLVGVSTNSIDFPFDNPGNNPYAGIVTQGVDISGNQVFASLGSDYFTSETLHEMLIIETLGASATTITWSGPYGGEGRIAQAGMNFGTSGMVSFDPQPTAILIDPGLSFWTDPTAWSTDPNFPNNGNGGVNYDVQIDNGGTTVINSATDIVIENLTLDSGFVNVDGSLTVQDHADWMSGTFFGAGSVNLTGTASIGGTAPKTLSTALHNSGTLTWEEGPVSMSPSGMVETEVHNAGFLEMAGNGLSFTQSSGSPVLVNEATGVIRRQPVPGTATIDVVTINHGTVDPQNGSLGFARGLTNTSTGRIVGGGTVVANLVSSGQVAPGGPGAFASLEIDGDYEQLAGGSLVIEVGGTTAAGVDHDHLNVTGRATLGGRLELSLVSPPYTPTAGDEIAVITANTFSAGSRFASLFSPNLASVSLLAIELDYDSPTEVRARFVPVVVLPGNHFVQTSPTTDWALPSTWNGGIVPGSTNALLVENVSGAPQQIDVVTEDAFTHRLEIAGTEPAAPMTVAVFQGRSLSATESVTASNHAAIRLGSAAPVPTTGNLVSAQVLINEGGKLSGSGTIVGTLDVGTDGGLEPARIEPGITVGQLNVIGDYAQGDNGAMTIDVNGTTEGNFDTVEISGSATLRGSLTFDLTNYTAGSGNTFEFLAAGRGVAPGETLENVFQNVESVGNDDLYVALTLGGFPSGQGGASLSGSYSAGGEICEIGDMNCSGAVDGDDVPLFARALRAPSTFHHYTWNSFVKIIFANDAGNVDGMNNGLDFDDIDDFAELVAGSASGLSYNQVVARIDAYLSGVPEPSSVVLLTFGAWIVMTCRGTGRRRGMHYGGGSHSPVVG